LPEDEIVTLTLAPPSRARALTIEATDTYVPVRLTAPTATADEREPELAQRMPRPSVDPSVVEPSEPRRTALGTPPASIRAEIRGDSEQPLEPSPPFP
jgi:hypothetical protein